MVVVSTCGKKVVKIVCPCALHEKMTKECEVENENEVLICLEDFNNQIGKEVDGFKGVHRGFRIGRKNVESRFL